MRRSLLPLACSLFLAACGTTGKLGPLGPTPPAPDPPPAAVCAPLEAEPLPPEGVDQAALYGAVLAALGPTVGQAYLEWHETAWPSWARRGWRRLEVSHRDCQPTSK
jgi:hypothetical protein